MFFLTLAKGLIYWKPEQWNYDKDKGSLNNIGLLFIILISFSLGVNHPLLGGFAREIKKSGIWPTLLACLCTGFAYLEWDTVG